MIVCISPSSIAMQISSRKFGHGCPVHSTWEILNDADGLIDQVAYGKTGLPPTVCKCPRMRAHVWTTREPNGSRNTYHQTGDFLQWSRYSSIQEIFFERKSPQYANRGPKKINFARTLHSTNLDSSPAEDSRSLQGLGVDTSEAWWRLDPSQSFAAENDLFTSLKMWDNHEFLGVADCANF